MIRNEFQQGPIRVAEIYAHPVPFGPCPLDRPKLELDATFAQMRRRVGDRPRPHEAQVAVARPHRIACDRDGIDARTMQVELLIAKAIREPFAARDHPGARYPRIKRVRAGPIGDETCTTQ